MVFPPPGLFSLARYALIHYLQYLSSLRTRPVRRVLLPDYMCHEVATSLRYHGYESGYYALDQDFGVSGQAVADAIADSRYDVVLFGHFYGKTCPNLAEVSHICHAKGITVIEDCVHLPFPYHADFLDSHSDAKLFTHRKVYPIPFGASIVLKDGQAEFAQFVKDKIDRRYWVGIMETIDWAARQIVKKGLQLTGKTYAPPYRDLSNDPLKPFNFACPGTAGLLSMRNLDEAVDRRRKNYETYLLHRDVWEARGRLLEFDLKVDVPYMFVMYITNEQDAPSLVARLAKQAVPAVQGMALDESVRWRLPRDHDYHRILALPLHQDIHAGHIQRIARALDRT